jgi:hypothetical protein
MTAKDFVIVGIDNGLDGGLCALSGFDGSVIQFTTMPTVQVGDKREVSPTGILQWLDQYRSQTIITAIEEPLRHAASSQAMRSMAISFGKCVGLFEAKEVTCHRIQVLDWQEKLLGKRLAKGQTKIAALAKANELWPNENWLANSRCRTAHDGIVDAALLAHFCRNHLL